MSGKFLLLCYFFPPAPMGYSNRVSKLCKYMPRETGWVPQVICGELSFDTLPGLDYDQVAEIPEDITVERTGSFNSSNQARVLRKWHFYSPIALFRKFLIKPDAFGDWIRPTMALADLRFPEGEGLAAILASGPPNSVWVAGARLSKKWNKPLFLDMRDPWQQIWGKYQWLKRWLFSQTLKMEREVYQQAQAIITNTPGNMQELSDRFPEYSDKLVMIPNGYDPEDIDWQRGPQLLDPADSDQVVHFLYLGGLRGRGFEESFFRVVAEYLNENQQERRGIKIHFVGGTPHEVAKLVQPHGLADVCLAHGVVPGNAVGRPLAEADIYVLLLPSKISYYGWVPSKLYYYLAGGKCLFAMLPEGSAKEIVNGLGDLAETCNPGEIEQSKAALSRIIQRARQQKQPASAQPVPAYALPYDRRAIARQVGKVLSRVAGRLTSSISARAHLKSRG